MDRRESRKDKIFEKLGIKIKKSNTQKFQIIPQNKETHYGESREHKERKPDCESIERTRLEPDLSLKQQENDEQSLKHTEPGDISLKQTEPDDQLLKQTEPDDQSLKQTEPDDQSLKQPELDDQLLKQTEPDDQSLKQTEPDDQSLKQTEPDDQSLKQTEPDDFSLKQTEPDDLSLKQTEPDDQLLKQTELDDQSLKQTEPDDQSLKQTEPDYQSLEQTEPDDQSLKQPEPDDQLLNQTELDDQSFNQTEPDPYYQTVADPYYQTVPNPYCQSINQTEPYHFYHTVPDPYYKSLNQTEPDPYNESLNQTEPDPYNESLNQTEPDPSNQLLNQTEPDPYYKSLNQTEPDPYNESLNQTEPDPYNESLNQTEPDPSNQLLNQTEPDDQSLKQIEPDDQTLKETEHDDQSLKQTEPDDQSLKQIDFDDQSLKQTEPDDQLHKQTEPDDHSLKQTEPHYPLDNENGKIYATLQPCTSKILCDSWETVLLTPTKIAFSRVECGQVSTISAYCDEIDRDIEVYENEKQDHDNFEEMDVNMKVGMKIRSADDSTFDDSDEDIETNGNQEQEPDKLKMVNLRNTSKKRFRITDNSTSDENNETENQEQLRDNIKDGDVKNKCIKRFRKSDGSTLDVSHENGEIDENPDNIEEVNVKKKGRKRTRNTNEWKKTVAKLKRNKGEEYISMNTKKVVEARKLKDGCSEKCKLKCRDKINYEQRERILSNYWSIGDLAAQRTFIDCNMKEIVPKYRYTKNNAAEAPRNYNNAFYFKVDQERVRVCKKFFTDTLGISNKIIETVMKKKKSYSDHADIMYHDLRGVGESANKTPEDQIDSVRDHINKIPRIPSHYCRKDTKREYIDGSKTVTDLYADYKQSRVESGLPFPSISIYRHTFNTEFNIAFFQPKKDQCDLCTEYNNSSDFMTDELKDKYETHILEKDLSRLEKDSDKKLSSQDYTVAVYDLQAVLQCPRSNSSSFYYKSKLNNFNLTIHDITNDMTDCFFWNVTEGKRGAEEIGTCVYKFLQKINDFNGVENNPKNVIFYSDNCCGQNKNKFIIATYICALNNLKNIKSITHKFLIRGHTQNEVDSCHSRIEQSVIKSLSAGSIFTPDQYVQIIRTAKKTGVPYIVHELTHEDFFTIKEAEKEIDLKIKDFKISEVKAVMMSKDEPKCLKYKMSFAEDEFQEIQCMKRSPKRMELKQLYKSKVPLKDNKKEDLQYLMNKNLIPAFYKPFYESLLN